MDESNSSGNTNEKIRDDKDVILTEYTEIRKEILQFQDFQNKMIFGTFTFYIAAGTFLLKILTDNNKTFVEFLENDPFFSWLILLFILFNLVIAGAFLAFNFTVGKASKYITGVLRFRFHRTSGRSKIFSWEDFYSKSVIPVITETLPGTLFLFSLYALSFGFVSNIWEYHRCDHLLNIAKYAAVGFMLLHLSLLLYWIATQIIKPIEKRKKITNT